MKVTHKILSSIIAIGILSVVSVHAGSTVVLEGFEHGYTTNSQGKTNIQVFTQYGTRNNSTAPPVSISLYTSAGPGDPRVTEGTHSAKIVFPADGFGNDFAINLSDLACSMVENAASSNQPARYILRYDVILQNPALVTYFNEHWFIANAWDYVRSGGGILTKVYLGLHPRLFIGGAADLRSAVGSGPLTMSRDDYQLLARLIVIKEDESLPALALGYDGPAYEHGAARGLYLSASKEFPTSLAYFQVHGGLNSGQVDTFRADRDLRASAALTTAIRNVGAFTEIDELMDPVGPRWNAGLEFNFAPIVVAVELRDLGGCRPGVPVSRMLRLSYTGQL